eukprot:CAMPEP_0177541680 /NCGR_PEP_ID=MMETSP0369-20130122/60341_1 /TAXON_ID=447022 ORGANISM="Scrippsiella hangoei-like, Strain SHHI-4" /NCGR_SAMPLE_ID=MMETSP0369 /ASSEMBLY_ACC=CAM_ASM_000364 /LENGTH=87 /DNA_ID=CAMNT_0019025177 /DNA_START=1 /DNA_END=261 /DNA_ORIENTATION=+
MPVPLTTVRFAPMDGTSQMPQPLLYTADAKGFLRCWDLSVLFERRKVVETDLAELFAGYYHDQLRLAVGGGHPQAPTPPAVEAAGGG